MNVKNRPFVFVRTGGIDMARYGVKGTVECKLSEPLGIEYCSSFLKAQGVEAEIVDFFLFQNEESAIARILSLGPLCIGFSVLYSHMLSSSYEVIKKLRAAGYEGHITIGGTYPTLSAQFVLDNYRLIDSIVMVEGEIVCASLACSLRNNQSLSSVKGLAHRSNGQVIYNQPQTLIESLDGMPNPDRSRFADYEAMGGIIQIHSSRGCHKNCKFCGTAAFYRQTAGKKWRCRSADNVAAELFELLSRTERREVWMTDDNFIGPGLLGNERAIAIADRIIENGERIKLVIQTRADNLQKETLKVLKGAGLRKVYIGVESGLGSGLALYGKETTPEDNFAALKLLEDEEIFAELGFIGFNPHTTLEELEHNIAFLKKVSGKSCYIHPFSFDMLIPYRGTPLANKLLLEGLAEPDGLDYRSVITDPIVLTAFKAIDYAIVSLGPATEHIKSLIISDDAMERAKSAIASKNEALFAVFDYILCRLRNESVMNPGYLLGFIDETARSLNKSLGI